MKQFVSWVYARSPIRGLQEELFNLKRKKDATHQLNFLFFVVCKIIKLVTFMEFF